MSEKEGEGEGKEPKIFEKMEEKDWRGILSVLMVVGYFAIIAILAFKGEYERMTGLSAALLPLIALIVKDYFESRKR